MTLAIDQDNILLDFQESGIEVRVYLIDNEYWLDWYTDDDGWCSTKLSDLSRGIKASHPLGSLRDGTNKGWEALRRKARKSVINGNSEKA